jgi:hypothetical protein
VGEWSHPGLDRALQGGPSVTWVQSLELAPTPMRCSSGKVEESHWDWAFPWKASWRDLCAVWLWAVCVCCAVCVCVCCMKTFAVVRMKFVYKCENNGNPDS